MLNINKIEICCDVFYNLVLFIMFLKINCNFNGLKELIKSKFIVIRVFR